jgi:hypothetical protein
LLFERDGSVANDRDRLPPDFAAMQHGQRAVIPAYKCSITYSITSSAITNTMIERLDKSIKNPAPQ